MLGNAQKQIELHLGRVVENCDLAGAVDRGHTATWNKLDVALGEGRHQRSRGFGRGRHRTWQRQHEADFAGLADALVHQVIVQHQGAFAGRRRTLEGGPADPNDRVAL